MWNLLNKPRCEAPARDRKPYVSTDHFDLHVQHLAELLHLVGVVPVDPDEMVAVIDLLSGEVLGLSFERLDSGFDGASEVVSFPAC